MIFCLPDLPIKRFLKLLSFVLILFINQKGSAQNADVVTLRKELTEAKTPLQRFNDLRLLFNYYLSVGSSDSMAIYSKQMLDIGKQLKNDSLLTIYYGSLSVYFKNESDFIHSLESGFKSMEMARASKDLRALAIVYGNLGSTYLDMGNYETAIKYVQMALDIQLTLEKDPGTLYRICSNYGNMAEAYSSTKRTKEALRYAELASQINAKINVPHLQAGILGSLAKIFDQLNKDSLADGYFRKAIRYSDSIENLTYLVDACANYSNFLIKKNNLPLAKKYALKSLEAAKLSGNKIVIIDIARTLGKIFDQQQKKDSAYYFAKMEIAYRDTIFNEQKLNQIQDITFAQHLRENEEKATLLQAARERKQNLIYSLIAIGLAGFIILFLLFSRRNLARLVKQRTMQVVKQKEEIEHALDNLEKTQEQLIRQEKFASIGQLTKGIMDRIQNPLNYIINFALINKELNEDTIELLGHDLTSTEVIKDIKHNHISIQSNIGKVIDHGRNASRIVKAMEKLIMEKSTDFLETDISALIQRDINMVISEAKIEHGNFDGAMIKTAFENNSKVKVLPAEISTVITNVLRNALYAVFDKMKLKHSFVPEIKVATKFTEGKCEIRIRDNGNGISAKELNHIFSPFFTTKPTSKGTGLGLYIAMDIIKAHKGEIDVETKEGEFTEFILSLPLG